MHGTVGQARLNSGNTQLRWQHTILRKQWWELRESCAQQKKMIKKLQQQLEWEELRRGQLEEQQRLMALKLQDTEAARKALQKQLASIDFEGLKRINFLEAEVPRLRLRLQRQEKAGAVMAEQLSRRTREHEFLKKEHSSHHRQHAEVRSEDAKMIETLSEELRRHEALLKEEREDAKEWQERFEQAHAMGKFGKKKKDRRGSRGGNRKNREVSSNNVGTGILKGGLVDKVRSDLRQSVIKGGGLGGEMLHPAVERDIKEIFG